MTKDRIQLENLKNQKKEIDKQINIITKHPNGKSYGRIIKELIETHVSKYCNPLLNSVAAFKEYEKIHLSISKILGTKTQVFTKDEYIQAISVLETKYNVNIPEHLKIK